MSRGQTSGASHIQRCRQQNALNLPVLGRSQAVAYDGIPFEIKKFNKTKEMKIMTEDEFLDRLAYSRKQSLEGKVVNADEAVNHAREKYKVGISK